MSNNSIKKNYEKKAAANIFMENPHFFEKISNSVPGIVAVYNIQTGKYIYANEAVHKILGYTPEEIIRGGLSFLSSKVHPDDLPRISDENIQILKLANNKRFAGKWDAAISPFEYRIKHKDGRWLWVKTDGSIFSRDKQGKVEYVLNITMDITASKETEENLIKIHDELEKEIYKKTNQFIETQSQFAAIVQHSNDAIISKNVKGIIISWNKAAERLLGYSAEEVVGKNIRVIIPPELQKEEEMIIGKIKKGRHLEHYETFRIRKDGTRIPLSITVSPIRNSKGEIIGASKIARDITEQKKNEERLLFHNSILQSVTDSVMVTDLKGNITYWNKGSEQIFGYTPKEMLGKTPAIICPAIDISQLNYGTVYLKKGKDKQYEWPGKRKDGAEIWLAIRLSILKNPKGKAIGFIGVAKDITERKEQERRKDDFISMASHELKTPVTSMKLFVHALERKLRKEGKPDIISYLEKIDDQIDKLTRLVGDLLDVSRIYAGKMTIHKDAIDLGDLVKDMVENFNAIIPDHEFNLNNGKVIRVTGDRDRIGQVLINLYTNAAKYSPPGTKILTNIEKQDREVIVSVQDFGMGIPKKHQDKIFDRFYQVAEPTEKTYPGLGMGLYICNQIVKRHGGRMWVESTKGKGSTFYFSLTI